jgi:hypothetical protein
MWQKESMAVLIMWEKESMAVLIMWEKESMAVLIMWEKRINGGTDYVGKKNQWQY